MKIIVCENCGKIFKSKKDKTRFCSKDCYLDFFKKNGWPKKQTNKIKVICAECGKEEYVAQSRAKMYKCCSVECLSKYNSKRYSRRVTLQCPICGVYYECKQSKITQHRTCGNKKCRSEWLSITRQGKNNANYHSVEIDLMNTSVNEEKHQHSRTIYQHIVKEVLGLPSVKSIPRGYVIHHKDANHDNNDPNNLIVLPKGTHRLIHTRYGNILIRALHTGKITKDFFFSLCSDEEVDFYKQIIDLNVTHQAVVKQGELLENPEEDNQQPSIYRNIFEGSTTNSRVLTDNAEDSNTDTSALPDNIGDDIV